ncbi:MULTISPECIES: GNAT family N-acetyltransferase [Enterococcus]|uniref:GNAT family N-acetyltransferase n=1 Tax=Enterococcus TaxID=1350 RepID=UPI00065E960C|nr:MULTISPECIES: GNAT family N-acetyltransferase [Enterococcus]KAF1301249.1 hypothetical protein BAU16_09610 [Enterococcus sp. JM9B]
MIRRLKDSEELPWALLLEADPDRGMVEGYLSDSQILVYAETKIIGIIVFQERSEWEILNLSVASDHEGKGIGGKLLEASFQQMRKQAPLKEVLIKTGDLSSPALHLYRKKKFQQKAIIQDYFVTHYSEPIYENGERLRNQVILSRKL